MTTLYKIIIQNRDYSSFSIINPETQEKVSDVSVDPIQHKMFSNDLFFMEERAPQIHSSPLRSREIPGILILENNKTYGRTANKKRLFYKCIPHDKQLPAFLVPYEIQLGFQKIFKNKYVTFRFDCWKGQHPQGVLIQTLGSTEDLPVFYEYQLYCRELHSSMIHFIQQAKKRVQGDLVPEEIWKKNPQLIEDRRTTHTVFSIDPAGATDFDDALSIRPVLENRGYEISVYIANVYLWMDIYQMWDSFSPRVATIYLPDKRRSLLPTIFSENLCSLQQGQDRFAFTMTLFMDSEGVIQPHSIRFSHTLLRVSKNYIYGEEDVENLGYNTLFRFTKKMDPLVSNSQELVAFWMIYMNTVSADLLYQFKTGLFRSSTSVIPSRVGLPLWNQYIGNYVGFNQESLAHESLQKKQYVHITSPIRRLVDIVNQTLLIEKLGLSIPSSQKNGELRRQFLDKCLSEIDRINRGMKSIQKVQSDCELVYRCFTNPDLMKREYKGIVCEKTGGEEQKIFQYTIYLEEFSLLTRIKCPENLDISSVYRFQLFLFEDEDKIQKKIRWQLVRDAFSSYSSE